ncbi:MAG: gfo/Idh/MocA family oxidoreductase [Clostridia bacterium]|nr:gfo/Idh/MocA family oxidoreductase [Clostridia bacterium]
MEQKWKSGADQIKVGVIGIGARGICHVAAILCGRADTCVTYVCDLYEDRCLWGVREVQERRGTTPKWTKDYRELIESPDVEVVVISSAWENHLHACVYAMECGKKVATEVGGAYSIDDCWKLVNTYEKTGIHCMMLENVCYRAEEMMVMRMVRAGLFGDIVHCESGYRHDIRDEIMEGEKNRHYRLRNYQNRNCENYPTHSLGPIAKTLDINRGNRMMKLVSMASPAWGLNEYARTHDNIPAELQTYPFKQGDIVTTLIQCSRGETISLALDTSLPVPHHYKHSIRGTKGFYDAADKAVFVDGMNYETYKRDNLADFRDEWEHPVIRAYREKTAKEGRDYVVGDHRYSHFNIDVLVFDAFFDSLHNNDVPPIDTYDTASWMAITPLSEISIANGSMPVDIPDFTRGMWTHRTDKNTGFYALDR